MAVGTARTAVAVVMGLVVTAAALLSPAASGDWDDDEVRALVAIRAALVDPNRVLRDWDVDAGGDPCAWPMVTCNQGRVYQLSLKNQNLSGTLSPAIEKLTLLQNLFLCNNTISGPIPEVIGRMEFLESLDLSNNQFSGSIPSTLGGLTNLQYLKLNNNSLSGPIPDSLAAAPMILTLFGGNPLLNAPAKEPLHLPIQKPTDTEDDSDIMDKRSRILSVLALCVAIACVATALITVVVMLFRHGRQREQVTAVDDVSSAISVTDSGLSQYSL